MQFSEEPFQQKYVFREISAHSVRINDTLHTQSLIITADQTLLDWPVHAFTDLSPAELIALFQGNPDIVLIGVGNTPAHLPPTLLTLFWEKRIGIETMTTPAAARTYNLLINEGRKVSLGLIIA